MWRTAKGPLLGGLWAWASSRLVLAAVALVAQSMRSGLFPYYPRPDLLCRGGPCTLGAFSSWLVPSLGVLLGSIALWGLVESRSGLEPARWTVWIWLAAPTTLALQFSASLAWATGLFFVGCWMAERRVVVGAVVATALAAAILPVMAVGSVGVAVLLWNGGALRSWWVPLLSLGLLWRLPGVVGLFPVEVLAGPGAREVWGVLRVHALVAVLPFVVAAAGLLSRRDRGLGVAGLLLAGAGAVLGVPWLGRLSVASPGWALVGTWAARSPLVRTASLGTLALFQGLLLHFYVHRVPVL